MMQGKSRWVLVEHLGDASSRQVVEWLGALELTSVEVAELNCAMVRSPCRLLPAAWFPDQDK